MLLNWFNYTLQKIILYYVNDFNWFINTSKKIILHYVYGLLQLN